MQCKNCKYTLAEHTNYCEQCGAKVIRNRLTFRALFAHFSEQFLNYDNKFLQTFITMFKKPEYVINGYIGENAKAIRECGELFCNCGYLVRCILLCFSAVFPDAFDTSNTFTVGPQTPEQQKLAQEMNQRIFEYQSLIFFLSIPILALLSRLVFSSDKKYNYVEHVVINLYTYSQLSVAFIILYMFTIWSPTVFKVVVVGVIPIQMIYYCFVLKRLYELTLLQTILKFLLFLLVLIPYFDNYANNSGHTVCRWFL